MSVTPIPSGGPLNSGPVNNNFTSLQIQVNGLIAETIGYGVQSGVSVQQSSPAGMNVYVNAGIVYTGDGNRWSISAQTVTIAPSNTQPRIDLVYVNTNGSVSVIAGVPSPSPIAPTLPSNCVSLALVNVGANVTQITSENIQDNRFYKPLVITGAATTQQMYTNSPLGVNTPALQPGYSLTVLDNIFLASNNSKVTAAWPSPGRWELGNSGANDSTVYLRNASGGGSAVHLNVQNNLTAGGIITVIGTGTSNFNGPIQISQPSGTTTTGFQMNTTIGGTTSWPVQFLRNNARRLVMSHEANDDVVVWVASGNAGSEVYTEAMRYVNASGNINIKNNLIVSGNTTTTGITTSNSFYTTSYRIQEDANRNLQFVYTGP